MSKEPAAKRQPFLGEIGLFFCQPVGRLLGSQRKLENLGNQGKSGLPSPTKGNSPQPLWDKAMGSSTAPGEAAAETPGLGGNCPFSAKCQRLPFLS